MSAVAHPELIFDDDTHTYRIGDRVLPSVTQLIPKGGLDYIDPDLLELTAIEGRRNHRILEDLVAGRNPDCRSAEEIDVAYALQEFLSKESLGKILSSEIPMYSHRYMFAGTADLICEGGIIDLKRSSGDAKIRALQMAGYQILAEDNDIIAPTHFTTGWREISRLKWWILTTENGRYKVKNVYNRYAAAAFLALLNNYKNNKAIENYWRVVI